MIIFICLFYCPLMAQQEKVDSNPTGIENTYSKILVCSNAFEALGKIADPKAKGILTEGLKSKDFFIRGRATEALGRLQDKETVPLLKTLVNDENYFVAVLATAALAKLGEQDMKESLFNFLNHKDPQVRATAIEQLGDFKLDELKDKFLPQLVKILSQDSNYVVREKAIAELGRNRFGPAVSLVRQALKDENAQVRRAACRVITTISDKQETTLLKERLSDKDISVRAQAKESLGFLGEKSLLKSFWKEVEDKEPILRLSSCMALAELNDINILPNLLKEIVNPQNSTFARTEAARALTKLKPHISDLVAKALSKSKTDILSLENLEVSYKINGKSLGLILTEALKDKNNPLHNDAPSIISQLQERVYLAALREALFDSDPNMVASAACVLGALRDKDAVDELIKVCEKYGF